MGFNPVVLVDSTKQIYITEISDAARSYLTDSGVRFTYIPREKLSTGKNKFDSVIALDEYFTFADNDQDQKNKVTEICNLALEYVITTCKDYKNQEFKDREFSVPALIKNAKSDNVFLEYHDHDSQDRNSWCTNVYQISNNVLDHSGPYARRALYFKQLAKFSHDAGAVGFNVHKNLMYKSLIKKNYEHVISIRFDNGS
jgi:arginine deiminase